MTYSAKWFYCMEYVGYVRTVIVPYRKVSRWFSANNFCGKELCEILVELLLSSFRGCLLALVLVLLPLFRVQKRKRKQTPNYWKALGRSGAQKWTGEPTRAEAGRRPLPAAFPLRIETACEFATAVQVIYTKTATACPCPSFSRGTLYDVRASSIIHPCAYMLIPNLYIVPHVRATSY